MLTIFVDVLLSFHDYDTLPIWLLQKTFICPA